MNTGRPDAFAAQALADLAALAPPHPDLQAIVVVPARDEAPRIAACLQALSTQRDVAAGSYELILILDGCRDRTLQVVQQTASLRGNPRSTPSLSCTPKVSGAPDVSAWTSPAGVSCKSAGSMG